LIIHSPEEAVPAKKPPWLRVRFPSHASYFSVSSLLDRHNLNTICRSARCPNIAECWSERTATFLILGNVCTRGCSFCAVKKGTPEPPLPDEPFEVAEAAAALNLSYVVVTSVTRDDLPDGGSSHFVRTIEALRRRIWGVKIEILIPDFAGDEAALLGVVEASPDVLNHNLETTEDLYPRINRAAANYGRSLKVLRTAKELGAATKSGLMIGLGETEDTLLRTITDLRRVGCDLLTIGQYLRPSRDHAPVVRYYSPAEFDELKRLALGLGFQGVESGPLVRSSFHAHHLYESLPARREDSPCAT
jgi:lipoic acid synthetase